MKTKGINYDIPTDLHHRFKVEAARQQLTLKAALMEAMLEWIQRQRKEHP